MWCSASIRQQASAAVSFTHGNKHPIKTRPSHITVIKAPALAFMGFLIMSIHLPRLCELQWRDEAHFINTPLQAGRGVLKMDEF